LQSKAKDKVTFSNIFLCRFIYYDLPSHWQILLYITKPKLSDNSKFRTEEFSDKNIRKFFRPRVFEDHIILLSISVVISSEIVFSLADFSKAAAAAAAADIAFSSAFFASFSFFFCSISFFLASFFCAALIFSCVS